MLAERIFLTSLLYFSRALRTFAALFDINNKNNPSAPVAYERSVSKPYECQTYVRNWDGSTYNEIIEFDFWDDKTGTGYYYLLDTQA